MMVMRCYGLMLGRNPRGRLSVQHSRGEIIKTVTVTAFWVSKGTKRDVLGWRSTAQAMVYAANIIEVLTSFRHSPFFHKQTNIPLGVPVAVIA